MTPLPILDLIAGIIFIYFLLAMINNSLVELLFALFKTRAFNLKNWVIATFETADFNKIKNYFTTKNDFTLPNQLLNHPLLAGASKENKSPSYMGAKSFAMALLDIVRDISNTKKGKDNTDKETGIKPLQTIKDSVLTSENLPVNIKKMLLHFIERTQIEKAVNSSINELTHLEKQIENWFDTSMERLAGKLKRWSIIITLLFASFITFRFNIDSISIAKYLYNNPEVNKQLAVQSYKEVTDSNFYNKFNKVSTSLNDSTRKEVKELLADMKSSKQNMDAAVTILRLGLPLGWEPGETLTATKIGGFIMTILAICLGAPFWFEVLGKVANLRSSLKPEINDKKDKTAK